MTTLLFFNISISFYIFCPTRRNNADRKSEPTHHLFHEKREIDLETLSQLTSLEAPFLKTMLTDNIYPPLGPLMKIARALGVRLGTFLDDQDSTDPFIIRRPDREAEISVLGGKGKPTALKFYSLGRGKDGPSHGTLFCGGNAGIRQGKNPLFP